MNNTSISPNAKMLIDEKAGRTLKLTLSSIRCGKTLIESFLKDGVVKIVGYNEDIPFASARVDSVYQLRKEYRGQGWQRQSALLTFSNEGYHIDMVGEDENPNCYLMVDRRELRIDNRVYRKMSAKEIRDVSIDIINKFVKEFNIFGSSRALLCEVKDPQNKLIAAIGPFAASTLEEMEYTIADNIPYEWGDPADQLLGDMLESVDKKGWFTTEKE